MRRHDEAWECFVASGKYEKACEVAGLVARERIGVAEAEFRTGLSRGILNGWMRRFPEVRAMFQGKGKMDVLHRDDPVLVKARLETRRIIDEFVARNGDLDRPFGGKEDE